MKCVKYFILFIVLSLPVLAVQTGVFRDNFDRPNSRTVGYGWSEDEISNYSHAVVEDNMMKLTCTPGHYVDGERSGSVTTDRTVDFSDGITDVLYRCKIKLPDHQNVYTDPHITSELRFGFGSHYENGYLLDGLEMVATSSSVEGDGILLIRRDPSFGHDNMILDSYEIFDGGTHNIEIDTVENSYELRIWPVGSPRPSIPLLSLTPTTGLLIPEKIHLGTSFNNTHDSGFDESSFSYVDNVEVYEN